MLVKSWKRACSYLALIWKAFMQAVAGINPQSSARQPTVQGYSQLHFNRRESRMVSYSQLQIS